MYGQVYGFVFSLICNFRSTNPKTLKSIIQIHCLNKHCPYLLASNWLSFCSRKINFSEKQSCAGCICLPLIPDCCLVLFFFRSQSLIHYLHLLFPVKRFLYNFCFVPISHLKEKTPKGKDINQSLFEGPWEIIIYVSVVNLFHPLKGRIARLGTWLGKHSSH